MYLGCHVVAYLLIFLVILYRTELLISFVLQNHTIDNGIALIMASALSSAHKLFRGCLNMQRLGVGL